MKKLFSLVLCGILTLALLPLNACKKEEALVLNVYNWEDYIACDEEVYDMVAEFEKWYPTTHGGKAVKVNYSTFGTNENMYNELKLTQKKNGDYSYDLVCPSEYMIQKMILEGMCIKFDIDATGYTKVPNYTKNVAPYIEELFASNGWNEYALCYNWGTMGFTYNPDPNPSTEGLSESITEDVNSWQVVSNPKYANKITIKDSVRDSYVLALGYLHKDELMALQKNHEQNPAVYTDEVYKKELKRLLNDFDDQTIEKARVLLTDVRQNLYGFEVDSGKQDMATGKLWINFAWSGDAVYAMDIAEEVGTELEYAVPKEGSNIFFDGWVMPKGANTELAQTFLNFMYEEEKAIENLDYICYSSPMVGEQLFEYVCDNYGLTTLIPCEEETDYQDSDGNYYEEVYILNDPDFQTNFVNNGDSLTYRLAYLDDDGNISHEEIEIFAHSVKHFFEDKIEGDGIIYTDSLKRQLVAMYPTQETMDRCVVMEHLETETLKKLNNMWDSVKVGYMKYSTMLIIVISVIVVAVVVFVLILLAKKGKTIRLRKKNLGKLVKSERIK